MKTKEQVLCADIIEHYGFLPQTRILQEECAELIMAASKMNRKADDYQNGRISESAYINNFVEELADVSIMIEQMNQHLMKHHNIDIGKAINDKLRRQKARMENE